MKFNEYPLSDICSRLSSGKSIKSNQVALTGKYPVYGGNGVRGFTDSSNFSGDCAIIGRQGAMCGNVRYFVGDAYMTEHAVVVCGNELANTRFLYYLLSTLNLGRLSSQSAQPGLSVKTISKQIVKLPDIKAQCLISSFLGSLDDKIEINNKIIKKLDGIANLHVKKAIFSKESHGKITKLSSIARIHQQAFNPKKHTGVLVEHYSIPAFDSGKYPIFELSDNIQSNKNKITSDCVLFSKLNPSTKRVWRPLCLTNYSVTSTEFVALCPVEGYSRDLIFSIINSDEFNSYICTKTSGSTNSRQRIRPSDALLFELNLPSSQVLAFLDKLTQPIYQLQSTLIKQNIYLRDIRDSLLPKLLSGEIELKN